ncbi:hypothetical protein LEP48_14870 [Isoptericola sp. NEAU-Y5]|uniref:Uncharacterized protein n=1 Tax=Isoptericola luteus TaxID=2879484 RepID=A0ABS7ZLF5_9MICO|nr:hypothetical protein [Isoptericola sp. NEAU-Y5]MCA5894620.1 hypothetical protein [Isoptericola sp. NEAU-Y5]
MALLILLTLVMTATLIGLARVVRRDGLGARRPPRSHLDWWESTSSP